MPSRGDKSWKPICLGDGAGVRSAGADAAVGHAFQLVRGRPGPDVWHEPSSNAGGHRALVDLQSHPERHVWQCSAEKI